MSCSGWQQVFVIIGSSAFLFIIALFITSCAQPFPPPALAETRPLIELEQNELVHYSSAGKPLWKLSAKSVKLYDSTLETHAEEVAITFLDADQQEALQLAAQRLIYHHRSGNLAITGNLRASDAGGIQFSTDEAFWDAERKILWSESPVQVTRDDFSLTGSGFEYDPGAGTLTTNQGRLEVRVRE